MPMPSEEPAVQRSRRGATARVRAAQVLMWTAALTAALAAMSAIADIAATDLAGTTSTIAETWRAYGLLVFAGLFALLASRPHASRGIWELVIFHKLAMTVTALVYSTRGGIPDTGTTLLGDGVLTLVLVAAYISCRGWRSWQQPPHRDATARRLSR